VESYVNDENRIRQANGIFDPKKKKPHRTTPKTFWGRSDAACPGVGLGSGVGLLGFESVTEPQLAGSASNFPT
jgi:hypothetical protein